MHPLEEYVRALREIHFAGVAAPEVAYYSALSNLLNEVGKTLDPKVRCILQLKDTGAGIPDGGLFTPDQLRHVPEVDAIGAIVPARGVVEAKGTAADAWATAGSEQVAAYLGRYRQVLVTNLRDFVLAGLDREGLPEGLESYRLAENERAFWVATASPRAFANRHGQRFLEFLRRVMLSGAPLAVPKDLAWLLASYARDARMRIEGVELDALTAVRGALEEALGMRFEGERGDHFFRSTLVQTLFYGIFSAWVLWAKRYPPASQERFNWHEAAWYLRVPMIGALFEYVATRSQLEPLGLVEVLDWAAAALNRVDRAAFFDRFEEGHAVQYFYEPFLEAFDPELRKQLGVWYTPAEVVKYMVARVETVLREELEIPDGLADPRVYVLDPCTGTGSYLVEVLRRIAATLRERGEDALSGERLKRAATQRVFGFEILPAPFVIAHLQLGLLLQGLGAPLAANERAGVYLTNALTGWESGDGPRQTRLPFPWLEAERDAAETVKRDTPILAVIGNPPYNGYAGVAVAEERALTEAYRTARATRQPQGQGLNDLYVRFFRMAERRIVEQSGEGVVCLISNYSWLDGLSFTGMRERYLEAFDRIWIDCLNGDKYKTGKLTPEGKPDPSIFSTQWNREGIQVGTAIALMVRRRAHEPVPAVRFRHLWGMRKRDELLASAEQDGRDNYQGVTPPNELGLPFMPTHALDAYFRWPSLPDIFPVSFPGVKTSRDDVVVDIDRDRLIRRMQWYFDPSISDDEIARIMPGAMESTARFDARAIRAYLLKRGFLPNKIVRHCYRPFDLRWLYWEPETELLDRKREEYVPHVSSGNIWMVSQQKPRREWSRPQAIRHLGCLDLMDRGASCIPVLLRPSYRPSSLPGFERPPIADSEADMQPNLTRSAAAYLSDLSETVEAEHLFQHSFATLHSPAYANENAGALRQDWPRIPLPATREALAASAELGRRLAELLDPERPVPGVTAGALRPELRAIGVISRIGGGNLDPSRNELAVTAGWGHAGQGGVSMPARGKAVAREYTPEERAVIAAGAEALGLAPDEAFRQLGETTFDVYLNDVAYWRNVPERVWTYTIGGYQVIKKWLSYREQKIVGRDLRPEEVEEVRDMTRRIAAILLLQPALDANYAAVKADTYAWTAE